MWRWLTKQYDTGTWLGAVKALFSQVMFYYGPVSLMAILSTAYKVWESSILRFIPWANFYWFMVAMVALFILGMLLEYKWGIPSTIRWSNLQAYKHDNPIRADLTEIKAMLAKLLEEKK